MEAQVFILAAALELVDGAISGLAARSVLTPPMQFMVPASWMARLGREIRPWPTALDERRPCSRVHENASHFGVEE